jgi:hypothetical protein
VIWLFAELGLLRGGILLVRFQEREGTEESWD